MKNLIAAICAMIVVFLAWTYIYNAEFHLFIIPEIEEDEGDNFVRFFQCFTALIAFFLVLLGYKEIEKIVSR